MAFSISPAATEAIRSRIARSTVERPVAAMIDTSDDVPVSREMAEAVLRKASDRELRELAKRDYSLEKLEFHLTVAIYSKHQFPFWAVTSIGGLDFALPLWARIALRKWTLDHTDNRFLLRRGDEVRYRLTDARHAA